MNAKEPMDVDRLRRGIREAFPSVRFQGAITPADRESDEDFSDERALHDTLHGRRWTDIPFPFVESFAYALPLLTRDAFASFLPAWLDAALVNSEVREALLHTFAKEVEADTSSFMRDRVRRLDDPQMRVLARILAHSMNVETGTSLAKEADLALQFVLALSNASGPIVD